MDVGDYQYNGMPVFNVNMSDFHLFSEAISPDRRLLSKNIMRNDLREFYRNKKHGYEFYIQYEGIILDMRGRLGLEKE